MAKEVKEEKNSKIAALEAAIDHINKQYGAGAVMKLGENTHMTVETISPVPCPLTLHLESGEYQRDVLLRFMVQSPVERQRWHCIW